MEYQGPDEQEKHVVGCLRMHKLVGLTCLRRQTGAGLLGPAFAIRMVASLRLELILWPSHGGFSPSRAPSQFRIKAIPRQDTDTLCLSDFGATSKGI